MSAFHFGDPSSPLFGVLTRSAPAVTRSHGVLLCPPIGQEHVRSHWALRQASVALSRAGFDVLRFDWFGVGDSSGELFEASVDRWKRDLAGAARQLREVARPQRVSLVGLRFGATLAALAVEDIGPAAVVLWDPVVDGRRYIAELRALTRQLVRDPKRYWKPVPDKRPRACELVGLEVGARLLSEIEGAAIGDLPSAALCLLRSSTATDLTTFAVRVGHARSGAAILDTEVRVSWTSPDDVERLLLPGDAVRLLVAFLEERA